MQKATAKNQQSSFQRKLNKLSKHLKSKQHSPDQEHYAALRLWMLDQDYHFNQLRNDCVNIILFLGKQMAETNDEVTRRKHYGHMQMMAGLYEFFDDAVNNHLGINTEPNC
ncbi:DUF1943 domain-containing protein [Niastella caeni]|uniref:DUF1943 domain-containing protein n=1 Tax=Niastella caeni TaxID=2569763 RepID=A0A4S8HIA2_9BACT|nr:DUF1943 domain-containing protein [Niastella caeni]THU34261.1 DUF1943 domain-containing protein [Niastella caeni]